MMPDRFDSTRRAWSGCLLAAATLAVAAKAQQREFVMPVPLTDVAALQELADSFTFVRIAYQSTGTYAPGGEIAGRPAGPWATDYPDADREFSRQVEERLALNVDEDGVILTLTDPALSQYPFIYLVEGGRMRLSDDEVLALREYLVNGGFLMVDDFWGELEWASLAAEFARVFPARPIIDLPADHEIFSTFYSITERPDVPGAVELSSGRVFGQPHYRGIAADDGRLMVILLHNLDFGDAWEHVADPEYPVESSLGGAVVMGINFLVYALSH